MVIRDYAGGNKNTGEIKSQKIAAAWGEQDTRVRAEPCARALEALPSRT